MSDGHRRRRASGNVRPDGGGRACWAAGVSLRMARDNPRLAVYSGIVLGVVMSTEITKGDIVDLMLSGNCAWRQRCLWVTASE